MKLKLLYWLIFSGIILSAQTVEHISYSYRWYDSTRDYRTFFIVESGDNEFFDKPVEFDLNFTTLLQSVNNNEPFDISSIRIIEITSNLSLVDSTIEYQFDEDSDFNTSTKASGKIIFMMSGSTTTNYTRYYHLYFDAGGKSYPAANFSTKVSYEDNVQHEGQSSYKIETESSTYYYHKTGAGFASIEDINGNDWINFSPSQIDQSFRGVPNLGDWAHPGFDGTKPDQLASESSVISSGPIKLTIESVVVGNVHKLRWEIYPDYAELTVINPGGKYHFLYEGTPGGSWDHNSDYIVRNNYQRTIVSKSWTEYELEDTEWLYFGDNSMERVIYFVNQQNDELNDMYKPHNSTYDPYKMTVFGFGRTDPYDPGTSRLLTATDTKFTFGFYEDSVYADVKTKVNSSLNEPTVNLNPIPLKLSAKLFLQGPYNSSSMNLYLNQAGLIPIDQPYSTTPWEYLGTESVASIPADAVDWVLIEIRSSTSAETIFKRKAGFLRNDGYLLNADGSFPFEIDGIGKSDFYLVVRHRNHLGVMTASIIVENSGTYEINFSSDGSAYGLNPTYNHSDENYLLRSGDGNVSGDVTASDRNLVWRPQNGTKGYLQGDYNLSGDVTASDVNLNWRLNNGRLTQIPN